MTGVDPMLAITALIAVSPFFLFAFFELQRGKDCTAAGRAGSFLTSALITLKWQGPVKEFLIIMFVFNRNVSKLDPP